MQESKESSLLVEDSELVSLLSNPDHLQYIGAFIGRERTVQEVANETRKNFNTTYKRVQRYCDLGLLRVTRKIKRKGRAIKLYTAVADSFLVPQSRGLDLPSWYTSWYNFFRQTLDNSMLHINDTHFSWSYKFYRDDHGVLTVELVSNFKEAGRTALHDAPAFLARFNDSLYLNFEDAKALQQELLDVWKKYLAKRGAQRYLFQVILLPVQEAEVKIT